MRLPTEADWEYACRAGTTTPFSFGHRIEDLKDYGNYRDKSAKIGWLAAGNDKYPTLAPVKSYKPNRWGLYDMHGNAMEWCADWMGAYPPPRETVTDPKGPGTGKFRMVRGGAWYTPARKTRSAARLGIRPDYGDNTIGFRVVMAVPVGPASGRIGLGTWKTQAEFKDVRVTRGKEQLFAADFAGNAAPGWQVLGSVDTGKWYDVKIKLQGRHVRCLLNGEVIHDVDLFLSAN